MLLGSHYALDLLAGNLHRRGGCRYVDDEFELVELFHLARSARKVFDPYFVHLLSVIGVKIDASKLFFRIQSPRLRRLFYLCTRKDLRHFCLHIIRINILCTETQNLQPVPADRVFELVRSMSVLSMSIPPIGYGHTWAWATLQFDGLQGQSFGKLCPRPFYVNTISLWQTKYRADSISGR